MKKPPVLHPFLFVTFPILTLFADNFWEISYGDIASAVLVPMAWCMGVTCLLLVGLGKVLHNYRKAGIALSISILLFFSYGHFCRAIDALRIPVGAYIIGPNKILFPLWLILFAVVLRFCFKRTEAEYSAPTRVFNVIAMVLIILPLSTIAMQSARRDATINSRIRARTQVVDTGEISSDKTYRDIYYIIFDRYASGKSLREFYDFDNSPFEDDLIDLGFYVARDSTANYLKTAHSLASSLNMEYVNWLEDIVGRESNDWSPLQHVLLQKYAVLTFLRAKGYRILHFGSWWAPTSRNLFADYNFTFGWMSRFHRLLVEDTFLSPVMAVLHAMRIIERHDFCFTEWQRVRRQFDELETIPFRKGPTFTFVHMNIPHPPHIFDQDGNFRDEDDLFSLEESCSREGYVDQVIYINKRIIYLVKSLQTNSELEPIIIIQGDEGPFPIEYARDPDSFDWTKASALELRKKMGILNAYYLPGVDSEAVLYPGITPVNSFRVVFDLYFDTKLELLPDRNYIFRDHAHLYEFFDVTDMVAYDESKGSR